MKDFPESLFQKWLPFRTFECVTSGRVFHFGSTRKLPFQQRHFPFLPFFIQRWFHSIIHICWLRKKVVQKQIPITFLNRSDISFSDGREHHLMGVISGMSRRFGRKSHFTLSWRWKHNKLLWSHLTFEIENYVGDLECVISGMSLRFGRKSLSLLVEEGNTVTWLWKLKMMLVIIMINIIRESSFSMSL